MRGSRDNKADKGKFSRIIKGLSQIMKSLDFNPGNRKQLVPDRHCWRMVSLCRLPSRHCRLASWFPTLQVPVVYSSPYDQQNVPTHFQISPKHSLIPIKGN